MASAGRAWAAAAGFACCVRSRSVKEGSDKTNALERRAASPASSRAPFLRLRSSPWPRRLPGRLEVLCSPGLSPFAGFPLPSLGQEPWGGLVWALQGLLSCRGVGGSGRGAPALPHTWRAERVPSQGTWGTGLCCEHRCGEAAGFHAVPHLKGQERGALHPSALPSSARAPTLWVGGFPGGSVG